MFKIILALLIPAALFTAGCTKSSPACAVQQTVEAAASAVIAGQLSCSNPDAIKASLDTALSKLNLCQGSIVGNAVCPIAVDAVMTGALATIPSSWGCTGGNATDALKSKLLSACEAAIPGIKK